MFRDNCTIAKPTLENSGFSLTEQCDTLQENQLSEQSMPSVRSILVIYLGRKRWLWSDVGGKSFRGFLGGEIWYVFCVWVRFDFQLITPNLLLIICLQRTFTRSNCLLCLCQLLHWRLQWSRLFRNKFQSTFERGKCNAEKPLRPPRHFNFVHLKRMVEYLTFWFCSKKTWQKSQLSLYLVTRNCCNRQLVCYFAWMISSFYWTVISPQHYRCWVGKITTQEKKS